MVHLMHWPTQWKAKAMEHLPKCQDRSDCGFVVDPDDQKAYCWDFAERIITYI